MINAIPDEPALEPRKVPQGAVRQIVRDELRLIRDAGGLARVGTRFYRYTPAVSHLVARRLEAMGLIEWTRSEGTDLSIAHLTDAGRKVAS